MKIISTLKQHPIILVITAIGGLLMFVSEVVPFVTGKDSLPELMNELGITSSKNELIIPKSNVEQVSDVQQDFITESLKKNNNITDKKPYVLNGEQTKKASSDTSDIKVNISYRKNNTDKINCDGSLDSVLDCKL